MFYLRIAAALVAFVAASIYGVAIALLRRDKIAVASDYAHLMVKWMRPALALRVEVHGEEILRATRPCVIVANHQSILDVAVLGGIYAPGAVVIAKKELRSIPFFGWLYAVTGNLLIDRADTHQSVGRLKEAEEAIREREVAIWIFPEGTRGAGAGELLPFKKGGFQMAIATGVPLVPVIVSPLKPQSDLTARRLQENHVEVRVLEPIPTAGMTEADLLPLIDEVRGGMAAELARMAAERGIDPISAPPSTRR